MKTNIKIDVRGTKPIEGSNISSYRAYLEDVEIGYIGYFEVTEDTIQIQSISINEKYKRLSVDKLLITVLENELRRKGKRGLSISILSIEMAKFLKEIGFIHLFNHKNFKREDVKFFFKDLSVESNLSLGESRISIESIGLAKSDGSNRPSKVDLKKVKKSEFLS